MDRNTFAKLTAADWAENDLLIPYLRQKKLP